MAGLDATAQPVQITTTLPTVYDNGPGTPDVSYVVYDEFGRPTWTKDADGYINYTAYDQATGAVVKTITDVDTNRISDFQNKPFGWSTPSGGGLHLITTMLVDTLGRTTKVTQPNGTVHYTVYKDASHEVRDYDWDPNTHQPIGPVAMSREDRPLAYTETLTFLPPTDYSWPTDGPTGNEPIGTNPQTQRVYSLSRSLLNSAGQLVFSDQYFSLPATGYDPDAATLGTGWSTSNPTGGNYYRTAFDYEDSGRLTRTLSPTGTINRTVYDNLGRVSSTWIGTNDGLDPDAWAPDNNASPSNMVKVSQSTYDREDQPGNTGVGDSNLTKVTQFPNDGSADRATTYAYDWRNRLVATKVGAEASESTSWTVTLLSVRSRPRWWESSGVS